MKRKLLIKRVLCIFINKSAPPIKCLLAEEDKIIDDNRYLINKLKEADHPECEIKIIPKRDHMSLIMEIKNPDDPALQEIVQFILKISGRYFIEEAQEAGINNRSHNRRDKARYDCGYAPQSS